MTYLNLVNNVLRRIREAEVSTVNNTTYRKMVGDFVNDAKQQIEDAWDWSARRETMTIDTTANVFNYVLTDSQNRVKVLYAYNDTSDLEMKYQTPIWFDQKYMLSTPQTGAPEYYVFNGVNENGDTQIDVYPKPDGIYTLRVNVIKRSGELVNDTDVISIPSQPIIHLAVALLARERGETGGTSAPEYFAFADKALSDAIALDAQKHPEEVVWFTC